MLPIEKFAPVAANLFTRVINHAGEVLGDNKTWKEYETNSLSIYTCACELCLHCVGWYFAGDGEPVYAFSQNETSCITAMARNCSTVPTSKNLAMGWYPEVEGDRIPDSCRVPAAHGITNNNAYRFLSLVGDWIYRVNDHVEFTQVLLSHWRTSTVLFHCDPPGSSRAYPSPLLPISLSLIPLTTKNPTHIPQLAFQIQTWTYHTLKSIIMSSTVVHVSVAFPYTQVRSLTVHPIG